MTSNQNQDREAVARRAYELYLGRGGRDGSDQSDWFRAEAELTSGNGARKNMSASSGATMSSSTPIVQSASAASDSTDKSVRPPTAKSQRPSKTSSLRK